MGRGKNRANKRKHSISFETAAYVFEDEHHIESQTSYRIGGGFIMTKTFTIKEGQKPTEEQLQEVREEKNRPVVFDEDCPELSPAMYKGVPVLCYPAKSSEIEEKI